jgi:hypothetical protein
MSLNESPAAGFVVPFLLRSYNAVRTAYKTLDFMQGNFLSVKEKIAGIGLIG